MASFVDHLKPHPQADGASILARERAQSSLSVNELSRHLFQCDGFLERQTRVLSVLEKEPLFKKTNQLNLSRPNRYYLGLARAKILRRLADKHGWDTDDFNMALYLADESSPYLVHFNMFSTTIDGQASEKQKEVWSRKSAKYQIIGAYAQTELGHGSNVRGLELEARWDPTTKEFILHSPTLTASKWWNGTLGRTANHAIVIAQLLIPEKKSSGNQSYTSYGPHPFVVQIRHMKTHQPLDGIMIGDIGPKYGYASMDNGYMLFNHFRIPHSAFLSRNAQLDPDTGRYSKPDHTGAFYSTLTFIRANYILSARLALARVATVAIRYTAIRRQFRDRDEDDTGPETAVLDYPTVQIRVLPLLATAFALHYGAVAMWDLYSRTVENVQGGDYSQLADMHSTSAGLKSLCTGLAANGIEIGRRALGGHGYGDGSGLLPLNSDYLAKVTGEGDNYMITQQLAAYLIKKATVVVQSPDKLSKDDTERMLRDFYTSGKQRETAIEYDVLNDNKAILDAFRQRAAVLSFNAYEARIVENRRWNSLLVQLHELSIAQSQAIIVKFFYEGLVRSENLSSQARDVLWDLYRLFAWLTMKDEALSFLNSQGVAQEQLNALPGKIHETMARIRPHAVKLVDAWQIPDYLLNSALGRYDGKVYEDLFNRAHRLNPLNKITFNPNYWEDEIVKGSDDGGVKGEILAKL